MAKMKMNPHEMIAATAREYDVKHRGGKYYTPRYIYGTLSFRARNLPRFHFDTATQAKDHAKAVIARWRKCWDLEIELAVKEVLEKAEANAEVTILNTAANAEVTILNTEVSPA